MFSLVSTYLSSILERYICELNPSYLLYVANSVTYITYIDITKKCTTSSVSVALKLKCKYFENRLPVHNLGYLIWI